MNNPLRNSRVLSLLRNGGVACSVKINLPSMGGCEIAAMSGADCVWSCVEHVPNDYADLAAQSMACKAHDTDFIVRVSRGSYSDLVRPLELGATGIMVPHVRSAQEARQLVSQTRFMPLGRRALDGGNADAGYCALSTGEYVRHANSQTLLILQIEDPEAMDELEAICQVPGYDMLFFGPGDYAHALGYVGELTHPEVVAARRRLACVARKHGRLLGTVGHGDMRDLLDEGFRFINLGADVMGLRQYYAGALESFRCVLDQSPRQGV